MTVGAAAVRGKRGAASTEDGLKLNWGLQNIILWTVIFTKNEFPWHSYARAADCHLEWYIKCFGENFLVCWDTTWHNDLLLPILRNGVCDWLVMPVEVFGGSSCHHTEDVERKAIPPFSLIYPLFRYEERICTAVLWTIMWGTVLLVFSKHANWSLEIFLSFLSVFSANWCTVQLAKLNTGLVAGTEMHVPRIYTTHTGYTLIIGNTYSVCVRLTFAIFLCQTIHWYACVCFITRIGIKKGTNDCRCVL